MLRCGVEAALQFGAYLNIYLDPWDVPALAGFGDVLARLRERRDEVELLVYEELTERLDKGAAQVQSASGSTLREGTF